MASQLLGVRLGARADEVDRAFRVKVRAAHPDVGGSAAEFRRLVEARETLQRPLPRVSAPIVAVATTSLLRGALIGLFRYLERLEGRTGPSRVD